MRSHFHLLNTLSTSFSGTSQNDPCLDPCLDPCTPPLSTPWPFRPPPFSTYFSHAENEGSMKLSTRWSIRHCHTTYDRFRDQPSTFQISPPPESADTEHSRQGQGHRPLCLLSSLISSRPVPVFLISCLRPASCCLLLSCLLSMPTLALFPYIIFHSLPIQTPV